MKGRVIGFSGLLSDIPLVLIHDNLDKEVMVNGKQYGIRLGCFGEEASQGEFVIRLSNKVNINEGDFLSFENEVLLQKAPGNSVNGGFSLAQRGFLSVSSRFEVWPQIRGGVLTVSDKGSCGQRIDTSGPALKSAAVTIGVKTIEEAIVPDEIAAITRILKEWTCEKKLELILLTGGTGLSPRDVTPEAVASLGGREVPGLGEYMRWKTSFQNERSIISRALAVAFEKTLIIALPGSERGSVQCFEAVAPVLRHAVDIISGKGNDCGQSH